MEGVEYTAEVTLKNVPQDYKSSGADINWAAKRYKTVEGSGWFGDDYDLQKTKHSPSNLSKSSDEKQ